MAYLILARHGITDWNAEGKWHGITDIPINEQGKEEARRAAEMLKHLTIDKAYSSELTRTKQTLEEICNTLNISCPTSASPALNERDYGVYTGKNKWQVKEELGEEKFLKLRRSWDNPVPKGESLKDVYDRAVPFYEQTILKDLKEGKNVLIVSSGNTLRALIKHIQHISDEDISKFELGFGEVYIYEYHDDGMITLKETIKGDLK